MWIFWHRQYLPYISQISRLRSRGDAFESSTDDVHAYLHEGTRRMKSNQAKQLRIDGRLCDVFQLVRTVILATDLDTIYLSDQVQISHLAKPSFLSTNSPIQSKRKANKQSAIACALPSGYQPANTAKKAE